MTLPSSGYSGRVLFWYATGMLCLTTVVGWVAHVDVVSLGARWCPQAADGNVQRAVGALWHHVQ